MTSRNYMKSKKSIHIQMKIKKNILISSREWITYIVQCTYIRIFESFSIWPTIDVQSRGRSTYFFYESMRMKMKICDDLMRWAHSSLNEPIVISIWQPFSHLAKRNFQLAKKNSVKVLFYVHFDEFYAILTWNELQKEEKDGDWKLIGIILIELKIT